jgi:putative secretion ATPase (PEP-CTERM system associated)
MYEAYFGLREKPFELVPNPDFLYLSSTHKRALMYINYGLMEKVGFVLLTGEVGSGKTTLIRNFIKRHDETVTLAKVFNTRVNAEQLLSLINEDFGLDSREKGKVELLKDLNAFLIKEYEQGRHPLLVIDEAQNLTPDLLEEVRMLSNLETDNSKLLQIVLVGQPELRGTLARPELRQLRQRISIMCHLTRLTRPEVEEYIRHRLEVAGNRDALQFTTDALDRIYDSSGGIPRLVNIICNFLMVTAFAEKAREVNAAMVDDTVEGTGLASLSPASDDPVLRRKALLRALGVPVGTQERGTGA